jgi:Flp pilus assembly protein TadD
VRAVLLAMLAALWLGACAQLPESPPEAERASKEEALSGQALFGDDPLPPLPQADILGVSPAMKQFLADYVDRRASSPLRLHQLAWAVINDASFGLEYTTATRTAAEAFVERNGNCLSFTNMFVALAREAGLKARYQQVEIPPDWEQRGDTYVLNRHINVLVETANGQRQAVDFNIDDFKTSYDRHVVPDRRAEAHYFSNTGVEKLQAGDYRGAFLYLRRGVEIDAAFAPLWTNLGALYSRAGHPRLAEASFLEALRLDSRDMVAISSLARLYERLGDEATARRYRDLARFHRDRNPYYRFHVAREAFLRRDHAAALAHLDFAIDKRPNEDSFFFLRGMVHLQLGNAGKARADLERAEAIADDDALKRNYHSKMELLLREQPSTP